MENGNDEVEIISPIKKLIVKLQSIYGFFFIVLISTILILKSYLSHNPLVELPVNSQLGILSVIPLEYYIALFLIFMLMIVNIWNKKKPFFYLSLLLFIFVFVNIGLIFQYNPVGSTDAYGHFLRGVNLQDVANPFLSYSSGSYPNYYFGSFVFSKMFCGVLGLKNTAIIPLLSIFGVFISFWFFSIIYLIFKKFTSLTKARLITIVMVLAVPYFHFHYSPHAFGLIVLPLFIYTIIVPKDCAKEIYILQALFFLFLMFTHGPTTLYIAMTYFFVAAIYFVLKYKKLTESKLNVNLPFGVSFLIGGIIANPMISKLVPIAAAVELKISAIGSNIINTSSIGAVVNNFNVTGTSANINLPGLERLGNNYLLPESIRLYVIIISAIIFTYGIYRIMRTKKFDGFNIFLMGAFFSTIIFSISSMLFSSLNLIDRAYLYIELGTVIMLIYLIPKYCSALKGISIKSLKTNLRKYVFPLLILIILLSPTINCISYYYNQGIHFHAPQNKERHIFLMESTNIAMIYSYRDNHGLIIQNDLFEKIIFENKTFVSLKYIDIDNLAFDYYGTYIVIADATMWSYYIQEEDDDLNEIISYGNENMNKVYSSTGNSIWQGKY